MKYRVLGRTGLKVSEIGFGCGNIGGLMVRAPIEEQVATVRSALDLGINYFDTAPVYGNGQSETNLGKVLSRVQGEMTVATKVGLVQDDLKDIGGAVRRSLETSLQRLQRDSVDVLQLHTPISNGHGNTDYAQFLSVNDVLGKNGVADVFDTLRSRGLIRFTGFTGLGDTDAIHKVVTSGRFDIVQVYYNLLNPSAGVAVPSGFKGQDFRCLIDEAAKHRVGIVVIRVLAGGALGGQSARTGYAAASLDGRPLALGGEYQADEKRASRLDFLVDSGDDNLAQTAIRFALGHPNISTVLVGISNLKQLKEAVACSEKGPLPDSALQRLHTIWKTNFGMEN